MSPPSSTLPPLAQHPSVYASFLELIHDTPLVRLKLESDTPRATVWGKLESINFNGPNRVTRL